MALLDELGEDEVFRLYLEHGSVPALCREIFETQEGKRPGPDAFYKWLRGEPERWGRWQMVLETRSYVEADLALDAANDATKDNVQEKRLKVDVHKWRAGIFNRDFRPGQSQVNVSVGVQVGNAWLEALKNVQPREIPTVQAEVAE